MSRNMRRSSTSHAPLVPDFPAKLDSGERVYPIRFSIGRPVQNESAEGQVGELLTILGLLMFLIVNLHAY